MTHDYKDEQEKQTAEMQLHSEDYLANYRDKSGRGYICPNPSCPSGTGKKGTGIRINPYASEPGIPRYKCFACDWRGDVIDYIAAQYGIERGSREAFEKARSIFGISGTSKLSDADIADMKKRQAEDRKKREADREKANKTASAYAKKCCFTDDNETVTYHKTVSEYLKSRGISVATAQRLHFGEEEVIDFGKSVYRLVVPVWMYSGNDFSFFSRRLPPNDTELKVLNAKGADMGFLNPWALQKERPIWICEGWADAASLEEHGHRAVSLNGVHFWRRFIEYLENNHGSELKRMRFIIAFDADDAGRSAAASFYGKLRELNAPAIIFDIVKDVVGMAANKTPSGKPIKDMNEGYIADKDAMEAAVKEAEKQAVNAPSAPATVEESEKRKIKNLWPNFERKIFEEPLIPIPTGFDNLDRIIGGGLFPNLYFLGALSGNGKTTFALQIADNIAKAGNDVLFFSLEMPTDSIMARSLSRLSYEHKNEFKKAAAKTELEIRRDAPKFSGDDLLLLDKAIAEYKTFANDHISIYTQCRALDNITGRNKRLSADEIMNITNRYIEDYHRVPLIIVDYLQILEPPEKLRKATPREQVDYAVSVFAEIRRELNAPVVVISSFNRNSTNADADTTSFKESGLIEYTADAVIKLETYAGKVTDNNRKQKVAGQMRNEEKIIKLTVLKNRMGSSWVENFFRYNSAYNTYTDIGSKIPKDTAALFGIEG